MTTSAGETIVFDGAVICVATKPVGDIPAFEVVHHPGAVAVIPHDDTYFYLTSQYRPAINQTVIELVAGTREPREDPLDTARRELAEEAGFTASNWHYLSGFYSSPGYCDEKNYLFRAWGLEPVSKPPADDSGQITIIEYPLTRIDTVLQSSVTAKTLIALLMLKQELSL